MIDRARPSLPCAHAPQIAAKARHAQQSVQSRVQRNEYVLKGEGIAFAEGPLPCTSGADDAGAGEQ
jgi:hypothetical protein